MGAKTAPSPPPPFIRGYKPIRKYNKTKLSILKFTKRKFRVYVWIFYVRSQVFGGM
jgi:hypothetical protein